MDNTILDNDSDFDFDAVTPRQVLHKYTNKIQALRLLAERKKVRQFHFDNYVLLQYFQQSSGHPDDIQHPAEPLLSSLLKIELLKNIRNRRRQILYWLTYFILATLCFIAYRQDVVTKDRSVQYLLYPGMRFWRRITLPLIQRFPHLTEYYDESCLMENPFYQIEDLSCEPCAHVDSVLEFEDDKFDPYNDGHYNDGQSRSNAAKEFVPFVFKINQSSIQMLDFFNIYYKNKEIFQRDAYRVQSTNHEITNLEELFTQFNNSDFESSTTVNQQSSMSKKHDMLQTHTLWRCNRMLPARLLRPLFARPTSRLPNTGIALERYVSFDTDHAPTYTLPDTECANVYVQQLLGTRFIILRPTSECRHRCRTLSMRLPPSFVLSYNLWYWKPISAPDPVANTPSISLIGSYC